MKVFVTSDWHLDAVTAGVERFDEIARATNEIVDRAIDERAAFFFFLGDLTDPDSPRAWRAVSHAIGCASRLRSAGVPSLWLAGNHDTIEDGHGTTTLEPLKAACPELGAIVVDEPRLIRFGMPVDFEVLALPFVSRCRAYDPAEKVREFASRVRASRLFVLGHLTIPLAKMGSESVEFARGRDMLFPSKAIEVENLRPFAVLNGHYHRRQRTIFESLPIDIPGSVARLTRGEADNSPGYLVIEVEA